MSAATVVPRAATTLSAARRARVGMRALALLAVLAVGGCGRAAPEPAAGPGPAAPTARLVDHAWTSADSTGLPGVMRVFLSDGTLLMDSCWETYQLVKWRAESDSVVSWQEGTAEVRARVLELGPDRLVLRLDLGNETLIECYRPAPVPFLCPDMRR